MKRPKGIFAKRDEPVTASDLVLTLPDEESEFVRQTYQAANRILEYGSGGSTTLAVSLGKPVISVESDATWAKELALKINQMGPEQDTKVVHMDIGPTAAWGKPADMSGYATYCRYPLAIWDDPSLGTPDVVLVDGRFRAGCVFATALRCQIPTRVLVDDYVERPHYRVIEDLFAPTQIVGRMAVFDISPGQDLRNSMTIIAESFADWR